MLCEHGNVSPCVECDIVPPTAENKKLVEALESLMKGYASLLEGGIDRITHPDGICYLISDMLQGAEKALVEYHKGGDL